MAETATLNLYNPDADATQQQREITRPVTPMPLQQAQGLMLNALVGFSKNSNYVKSDVASLKMGLKAAYSLLSPADREKLDSGIGMEGFKNSVDIVETFLRNKAKVHEWVVGLARYLSTVPQTPLSDNPEVIGMGHCQSSHAKPPVLITWQPARPPRNPKPATVVVNPMSVSTLPAVVPLHFQGLSAAETGQSLSTGSGKASKKMAKILKQHYSMPGKAFVKEHTNLIGILKRGKKSQLNAEARSQSKELRKFLRGGGDEETQKNETTVEPVKISKMDSKINEVAENLIIANNYSTSIPPKAIYHGLLEIVPKERLTYELEEKLKEAIKDVGRKFHGPQGFNVRRGTVTPHVPYAPKEKPAPPKEDFSPPEEEEYIRIAREMRELEGDDSELADMKKTALTFDEKISSLLFKYNSMEMAKLNKQPPVSILQLANEVLEKVRDMPESLAQKFQFLERGKRGRALETLEREVQEAQVFRRKAAMYRKLFQATSEGPKLYEELGLSTDKEGEVLAAVKDRAMKTALYYTVHPEAAEKRHMRSIGEDGTGMGRGRRGGVKLVKPPTDSIHMNPLALAAWKPPPSRGPLTQEERNQISGDNASSGDAYAVNYRTHRTWADAQVPERPQKKSKIMSCLDSVFSCMSIPVMAVTSTTGVGKPRRRRGGSNNDPSNQAAELDGVANDPTAERNDSELDMLKHIGFTDADLLDDDDIKMGPEFESLPNSDKFGPVNDAFLNRMIGMSMKYINNKANKLTSAEKREQYQNIGQAKAFMKQRNALEAKLLRERAREAAAEKEAFSGRLNTKFATPVYRTTAERGLGKPRRKRGMVGCGCGTPACNKGGGAKLSPSFLKKMGKALDQ